MTINISNTPSHDWRGQPGLKYRLFSFLPRRLFLELRWNANRFFRQSYHTQSQYLRQRTNCDPDANSLHPFDKTRSIFVHIPKCAGISVNHTLYGNLAGGHKTLDQYLRIFEPRLVLSYFKFSIVRNPWDRLVSAYHFLQKGGANNEDRDWFTRHLIQYPTFDSFVRGWLNAKNARSWYHFRPQVDYLLDSSGKVSLDFIGHFENLHDDFAYIAKKLGKDVTLANSNKSKHVDYRSYYDDETRDIVAQVYARDIALLGYTFDNSGMESIFGNRNKGVTSHE
ncbi:sulfotransferase family 2 domain-containing protein [Neptunicella sp. SCSIO 80796]|uniref:sulfotransferase family 2 domain-containing protein n=1 Tax=Neptunicella plasticusilytica TaxID=3117012 RepID=UPI003A4DF36C